MAKLYGQRPSVLAKSALIDWQFDLEVADIGQKQDRKDAERERK